MTTPNNGGGEGAGDGGGGDRSDDRWNGRRGVDRRIGRDRSVHHRPADADGGGTRAGRSPSFEAKLRRLDAHVLEAVEFGGVLAEESLVPHVRLRGTSVLRGSSSVMVDLLDPAILSSFRRQGLLRRCATFRCWTVDRRWSEAFVDQHARPAFVVLVVQNDRRAVEWTAPMM
ncbi:hypothetical protein GCM10022268_19560 [Sphingomonas cynarae]|uniref:Uncharacterized protein n=1 Tax=Sphingomonas cynarae TaxID=930197 RepID=A0ABP7DUZ9_9SPHN